jgi:hypothetical protein
VADQVAADAAGRSLMREKLATERRGWNIYYDLVDALAADPAAHRATIERIRAVFERCRAL